MPERTLQCADGSAFDRVAGEYDRRRPGYPEQLIDRAFRAAGLERGDEVLEIGCGTGQLTRDLLTRGLRVTALEPGRRLARLARARLAHRPGLELVNARFEDAQLPLRRYRAVFSASAIHWIDPDVGWQRAADALVPGGTLALIQYFGLDDPRSAYDRRALLGAISAIAPEIAESWPRYRDIETLSRDAVGRRGNVSELWAWLGGYDVAREHVADLFGEAQIAVTPMLLEHTALELNALLGTMSFWSRLSPEQQEAIARASRSLHDRLGRPLRSLTVACLVTAPRSTRPPDPAG